MDVLNDVLHVLDTVLSLQGRATRFTRETALLGNVPELDSMAVVSLITSLEDHFGISIHDDEIDGATFASVGTLADFVDSKVGAESAGG